MDAIPDGAVDLVVSGPPYYTYIDYQAAARGDEARWRTARPYPSFLEEFREWYTEVWRVLRPGRHCAVVVGSVRHEGVNYPLPFHVVPLMEEVGWTFAYEIVWRKNFAASHAGRAFARHQKIGSYIPNNTIEYVLVFQKATSRAGRREDLGSACISSEHLQRLLDNVWDLMPASRKKGGGPAHPCPFPPEVPMRLVALLSAPGELVLDPFAGAATTGRAALAMGRRFVGYEIVPEYAAAASETLCTPLTARWKKEIVCLGQ